MKKKHKIRKVERKIRWKKKRTEEKTKFKRKKTVNDETQPRNVGRHSNIFVRYL